MILRWTLIAAFSVGLTSCLPADDSTTLDDSNPIEFLLRAPDGMSAGSVSLLRPRGELCVNLEGASWTRVRASHLLHEDKLKMPIETFFEPPVEPGRSRFCVQGLSREVADEILTSPQSFRIDQHLSEKGAPEMLLLERAE